MFLFKHQNTYLHLRFMQVCNAHVKLNKTRMWTNAHAQRDGRPAEYKWRPLFNAAKFG